MHAPWSHQRHKSRTVAAMLFLTTSLAAVGVGFAHARERVSTRAAIEAEHGKMCVVLHDPARCPSCQAPGVATLPEPYRTHVAGTAPVERPLATATVPLAARRFLPTAAPRAPPLLA